MDTTPNVANAWQRLLRHSLLTASRVAAGRPDRSPTTADAGSAGCDAPSEEEATLELLPILYRSEAFAEDLLDSHPQFA